MKHLSLFLCRKYLCARKVVLLSIAAVALCCALLITVASLFTGFIDAFEKSSSDHLGDIVVTAPEGLNISRYDELIGDLQANPNIEAATGVLSSHGLLLLDKGNVRAVQVWGIELPRRTTVTPFAQSLIRQKSQNTQPDFALNDSADELYGFAGIGVLASADDKTDEYNMKEVKANIGKKVLLTTGSSQNKKAVGIKFIISDVVFSGIYEFDKNFIYLPIEELAEELYPGQGKLADIIHIRLGPGIEPQAALAVVRGIFRNFAREKLNWSS
ncbi:MAG: ABC transporter permease, partial [Deltaproteobacteria bacterium]|nr:ABC transporter permease [Deltaproteobacteria bacterium]